MSSNVVVISNPVFAEVHSARSILDQIADKWSLMILTVLCPQPSRFNAIKGRLGGITHKALADALRRLERNGLVTRRVIATSPIGVEYSITPLGRSLQQPFEALCAWAVDHGAEVVSAQEQYDCMGDHAGGAPVCSQVASSG